MKVDMKVVSQPDFPKMERNISGTFNKSTAALVPLGAKYLQGIIPSKTGKLRKSIGHSKEEIWSTADHYKYVDEGTRPHIIEGLLVFQVHGVTVFARNVHHPGTAPQHLTERTVKEIEKNMPKVVKDINRVIG